ncbi:hypothetical protein N1M2_181 [Klebsiella phage N1M2]|uniref:Uncharacterized protein n=1 Tax=Klebsiella phage N1M2 TaxID=2664939 RepID=A0A6B7ZFK8_9CAUD|nr:hypothetical protein PQB72_gp181 [Klebsiella phage N1M2]QGH72044.1 hypothetical protein N1M2_181 [Klebsiella phage N1M2]
MERITKTLNHGQYYYELANESFKGLSKEIEDGYAYLSRLFGWKLYLTWNGVKTALILARVKGFITEAGKMFDDPESVVEYSYYEDMIEMVREYDDLLNEYKSDIIKLFDMAYDDRNVDSETRFKAHTWGGRVLN